MALKIAVGCDHAGVDYKNRLAEYLKSSGYEVFDCGTYGKESVDYPLFAEKVCKKVIGSEADFGILICGTGIGMSMAANKFKEIRAALCTDVIMAEFTRKHNNANVLCMGARIIAYEMAEAVTEKFLNTDFEGGRHCKRIEMFSCSCC